MLDDKFTMFQNRLMKVWRHLGKQARRQNVSCFRVYDHDLPEFPFCIEVYDQKIYLAEYRRRHGMTDEDHDKWLQQCIDVIAQVMEITKENIFLKMRQKKEGRSGQYRKTGESRSEIIVEETGLKFIVNLSDYLDTGLFLDHRVTRQLVMGESKDKNVLNLFAYTGSFSVYAAAGGASEVTTVDLSNTYLSWAQRNMTLNEFTDVLKYKYIQADVMAVLGSFPDNYFDLIVLDPPTFSNSKRMDDILDIQRDHVKLINNCLKILSFGGRIYFSTNFRNFKLEIEKLETTKVKDITKKTTPFDFEGKINRVCFLLEK